MKVKELAERLGGEAIPTGKLIAYIKDGLEEINMISETHIDAERIDIIKDKRFYDLPHDYIRIIDVRCKNHENTKDEYRSIPRMVGSPLIKDADEV
tara:strand:- start:328 stop:615 length:288 start_codon:yes stop_codon:yes gene_type:complete